MSIDLDTYREESLETWAQMAPGWEDKRQWLMDVSAAVNDWLAEKAAAQQGETVLDLAAGTGDLGFQIAEAVGADGQVICADFSPEMLDVARRQGEARGVSNVAYRQLDAEDMDLADDSVDHVVCRFGYMLMADPATALRETRRVLRDGRLAFAVWAAPDRNPWAARPAMTLVQRGHMPPPEPGAPGLFAMADPARLQALVTGAGFEDADLEAIPFEFRYTDVDDVWDALIRLTGPLARAIGALPDDEREATRAAIIESVEPFRNDDGSYTAPAVAWGVLAR